MCYIVLYYKSFEQIEVEVVICKSFKLSLEHLWANKQWPIHKWIILSSETFSVNQLIWFPKLVFIQELAWSGDSVFHSVSRSLKGRINIELFFIIGKFSNFWCFASFFVPGFIMRLVHYDCIGYQYIFKMSLFSGKKHNK